jgi:H+/Cl- antiporter ClcA
MNHHNFLSIFFGSVLSIFSYIAENPLIQDGHQLVKVILFGIIGGAFGYFGKLIAIRIHKFFKS